MSNALIIRITVAFFAAYAILIYFYIRPRLKRRGTNRLPKPIGFLSLSEQEKILASEHVLRIFPGSRIPTVAVETKFKSPAGKNLVVEANVVDGKLTLVEPEGQRFERESIGIYPHGLEGIFEKSGCFVGSSGRIQYGPVVFTPQAFVDGVYYMARTCAYIYTHAA